MPTCFFVFEPPKTSFLTCFQLFAHCWLHLLLILRLFKAFKSTVPCLLICGEHKRHYYMCVSTITSKNTTGTLFVVCLSLNMFFVPFCCILSSKYINHTYPVAECTLNTRRTTYSLFLTAENVPFIFDAMVWFSKHQPYLLSIFETSKHVRRYLVCCLFASKYVISVLMLQFNW